VDVLDNRIRDLVGGERREQLGREVTEALVHWAAAS
jgi:hypothetical protein